MNIRNFLTGKHSLLERYLINVGIRSAEFTYTDEQLTENLDYFKECFKSGLSEYKALVFLNDHIIKNENKPSNNY